MRLSSDDDMSGGGRRNLRSGPSPKNWRWPFGPRPLPSGAGVLPATGLQAASYAANPTVYELGQFNDCDCRFVPAQK